MMPSWIDRPQQVRLRKWLFTAHLWIGIALGAYIFVVSVSGSAVVFRREFSIWLVPRSVEVVADARLTREELHAAVSGRYPEHAILRLGEPGRPDRPVQVALEREGMEINRLFDPYTGIDIGDPFPPALRAMEWLVKLHDDLLGGEVGRKVNGIGGMLVMALVLTGAVIWWPGRRRWTRSLLLRRSGPAPPRLAWQLHSVLGFWCFALLFIWAATGVYFAFPQPVESLIDYFDSDLNDFERPGEQLLLSLIQLHFGRFGGLGIRVSWAVLGLVPAALFVTGFALWWRRVRRSATKSRTSAAEMQSPVSS
jgi:uncharacterized iron-regulated membrane protein